MNSNSLRRSKQRLRDGHPLVDLILLFVGEKTLVARKREGCAVNGNGRGGIYCPLEPVLILDAPPNPCVR